MIGKLKRTAIPILILFVLLTCVVAFKTGGNSQKAQAEVSWGSVAALENIKLNDSLKAADFNRKVTIDGTEYDYDKLNVIYPDGTAVMFDGNSLLINQAGKYVFVYVKEIGDKTYSSEETVYVKSNSVTTGENTTVAYDKGDKAEKETSKGLLFNLAYDKYLWTL